MAEQIELRKERMLPELEQMKRIQLFDDTEIKDIVRERDLHNYRIQRLTKSLKDYLQFIKFEKNLLALIKERRKNKSLGQKRGNIEQAISFRIKNLYKEIIKRFPEQVPIWDEYILFCKRYKFAAEVSAIFDRMIQFHGDKPETWQKAILWELQETKNADRVKHFVLGGLQRHQKSSMLYYTFLKIKLMEAAANDVDVELALAKAELVYKDGKDKINDIEFVVGALKIVSEFECARSLAQKILTEMRQEYPDKELMWHTLAQREQAGLHMGDEVNAAVMIDKNRALEFCVTTYETALETLNTEAMWNYYLTTVFNVDLDTDIDQELRVKCVEKALKGAFQSNMISEKHLLKYLDQLTNETPPSKDRITEVLQKATEKYPQNVQFWELWMRLHIQDDEAYEMEAVFRNAIQQVPDQLAYPLWYLKLLFYQTDLRRFSKECDQLFSDAIKRPHPDISNKFKPLYLVHLCSTRGIAAARRKYNELCLQVPSSIEIHRQMADLEAAATDKPDKKAWRKCHEMATQSFGKANVEVWLELLRFERMHGDPIRISQIYQRALGTLDKDLISEYITKYNLEINGHL